MNMQRRAQGGSVVRGSRLHEHVVEHPAVGDEPVDRAVQGDTAGHAEPTRARSLLEVLQHMEDHVLKTCLNRGRYVTVPVIDGATGFPPFPEQVGQRTQGASMRFPFGLRVMGEDWDLVRPFVAEFDHLPHLVAIAPGVAVRRQSHHLVFVHHHLEAQIEREDAVQDPERLPN